MDGFEKLERKFRKFDLDKILSRVWRNPRVQKFIIDLNTKKQLFEKGEDSEGGSLGDYSAFTIQIKVSKGQRVDHITLRDTGAFYETFKVFVFSKGFKIEAKGQKEDSNLFDDFGENIVGISEESLFKLCEFIRPFYTAEKAKAGVS